MLSTTSFTRFLVECLPWHVRVIRGFAIVERDERTFMIDLHNGELHVQPVLPTKSTLDHIMASQCHRCFNHASPEAAFHCASFLAQGSLHPVRVCVVADFAAERRMADIAGANVALAGVHMTAAQLKILSMIFALHDDALPPDVKKRVDAIPAGSALRDGCCPYFMETVEMNRHLVLKNISRHERKRRFLDILLGLQHVEQSHHAMGTSYFNAKIAELRTRLASLQPGGGSRVS